MNYVQTTDGRTFDQSEITFDSQNYTWTVDATGEDISHLLTIQSRRLWPDFDGSVYSEKVYKDSYLATHGVPAPVVGSTSVTGNFLDNITSRPIGNAADFYTEQAKAGLKNLRKDFLDLFTSNADFFILAGVGVFVAWKLLRK